MLQKLEGLLINSSNVLLGHGETDAQAKIIQM